MPKRADLSDTFCPVGRSAEILGDRAVLLILRDLFFGRRRFEAIAANTGLGPQLVSARLKLLEKEGVVERQAYQDKPPRHEYRLTDKGKDLFGVLYAMRGWAERWAYTPGETGGGPAMRSRSCGRAAWTASGSGSSWRRTARTRSPTTSPTRSTSPGG